MKKRQGDQTIKGKLNKILEKSRLENTWKVSNIYKNRSAMRTWGLMLNFIPFGWNAVLKYQHLGVDLLQVKKYTSHYNF